MMRKTHLAVVLLLLLGTCFSSQLSGQTPEREKYWVFFHEKDLSQAPSQFLTQRSLDRRDRQGITVDAKDYPVSKDAIRSVEAIGVQWTGIQSKWLNGISVWMTSSQTTEILQLPQVRAIKAIPKVRIDWESNTVPTKYNPGWTTDQVTMLGLDKLHQNGWMGQGVLISVMDNGFRDVDKNPFLEHLFEGDRIIATRDFVNGGNDVFDQGSHGAAVLSILAGYYSSVLEPENNFVGSAPGASYILCHTEDDAGETHQEEDNWVAAMEFADSLGADIFSTSLGYREFDSGQGDYAYAQLDGNTTIITIAADIAASRGILVVNSAGNAGGNKLLAPADGDSVMAVAAVDASEMIAAFSSRGPSGDGRLKPDISAMGQGTVYIRTDGTISAGSGTSFSCPMMSGFAACLLQSKSSVGNMELFQAILASGDRHAQPDTAYGHGIPDGPMAYEILHGEPMPGIPGDELLNDYQVALYPNPAWDRLHLVVQNSTEAYEGELTVTDLAGRKVAQRTLFVGPFINHFLMYPQSDFPGISQGVYIIRVKNLTTQQFIYSGKVRLNEY